jgi:hypothetical protein
MEETNPISSTQSSKCLTQHGSPALCSNPYPFNSISGLETIRHAVLQVPVVTGLQTVERPGFQAKQQQRTFQRPLNPGSSQKIWVSLPDIWESIIDRMISVKDNILPSKSPAALSDSSLPLLHPAQSSSSDTLGFASEKHG